MKSRQLGRLTIPMILVPMVTDLALLLWVMILSLNKPCAHEYSTLYTLHPALLTCFYFETNNKTIKHVYIFASVKADIVVER